MKDKPKYGQKYWHVGMYGNIGRDVWMDNGADEKLWEIGNCFPTEKDARIAAGAICRMFQYLQTVQE